LRSNMVIKDKILGKTHNLETTWLTARIIDFMFLECHGANWWLSTITRNGKFLHAANPKKYVPDEEKQEFAHNVCTVMNRKAHYGGAWLVGWVDDGNALMCVWKDQDGDIQTMVDCIRPWSVISEWKIESWAGKAHKAYEMWYDMQDAVQAKAHQQIKLAQGQKRI